MTADSGFPPVATPEARVLVLGSMPGRRSLEQTRYYGHPQNAFWRIMSDFTNVCATSDYALKVKGLENTGIAVWDVIASCVRPGSLDADIQSGSIQVNDFNQFFSQHPHIQAVFFNGGKAAVEYTRRVVPGLTEAYANIPSAQLLSTSPANARFTLEQKKDNWRALQSYLNEPR